jgi:hypothetical protein
VQVEFLARSLLLLGNGADFGGGLVLLRIGLRGTTELLRLRRGRGFPINAVRLVG